MNEKSFDPALPDLVSYQRAREGVIAAREGFFAAVREYLRPETRFMARELHDSLWNSDARVIADEDWIVHASRGQLTIREALGRPFRVSVLQIGHILKIGVRLPQPALSLNPNAAARLAATFYGRDPNQFELSTGGVMLDWHFDVPDLYDSALAMETAIHLIASLLETALHSLVPQGGGVVATPPVDTWSTDIDE